MSMLERYKKKGGFIQLLNLIETSGADKREKFLKMIKDENPTWEAEIRKKMLSMERLLTWETATLMEVIPMIPAQAIAVAIISYPAEKQTKLLSALSFGEKKKVDDLLKELKPNPGEIFTCQMKILTEVRNQANAGRLKFDKFDAELVIPENIEEQLAAGGSAINLSAELASIANIPSSGAGGTSAAAAEEIAMLRKKLMLLTQEVQRLTKENKDLKDRVTEAIDSLKKVA